MKKIAIFALLLMVASCDTIIDNCTCKNVIVSDSQPIQFWPIDCDTYNEKQVCGVHPKCFCQPWQCDDEIKVPFQADEEVSIEETQTSFEFSLGDWFNTANGTTPSTGGSTSDWAWSSESSGSAKVTTVDDFGTKSIRLSSVSMPQQQHYVRIYFDMPGLPNTFDLRVRFRIRDSSNNSLLNQEFPASDDGYVDLLVSTSTIWATANHFLLGTSAGGAFVSGDEIHIHRISYLYDVPLSYRLKGYDSNETEVFNVPFESLGGADYLATFVPSDVGICDENIIVKIFGSQGQQIEIDPLSTWTNVNTGPGPSWTPGAAPTVSLPGSSTITDEIAGGAVAASDGEFTFAYDLDLSDGVGASGIDLWVVLYNAGVQVGTNNHSITSADGNKIGTIEVTSSDIPDEVRIYMINQVGSVTVTVNSFEPDGVVPDIPLYKSDCLDIREVHECTNLVTYSNSKDFDGIPYSSGSPALFFNKRVPSVFFHERPIQQDFSTSDVSSVVKLTSNIKKQRMFETDYMPYHEHYKLIKIFEHQSVFIDNKYWIKEEEYEINEGNKRWPVKSAGCYLTDRSSFQQFTL